MRDAHLYRRILRSLCNFSLVMITGARKPQRHDHDRIEGGLKLQFTRHARAPCGSSGSKEAVCLVPRLNSANIAGSTSNVATVARARPPTTALPRGADCSPDLPNPNA